MMESWVFYPFPLKAYKGVSKDSHEPTNQDFHLNISPRFWATLHVLYHRHMYSLS